MNTTYRHYGDKIVGYYSFLKSGLAARTIDDNDVIVLLDAYDVLLFPTVRRLRTFLSQSPAPIIFCAEQGIYPEFPSKCVLLDVLYF
jgi:hypothetical protein